MEKDEEIIIELGRILTGLRHPVRLKIAQVLLETRAPLSFIEIRERLGNSYEKDAVWLNLKSLERHQVVKIDPEKRPEKRSGPGRPKASFYILTERGKIAVEYLNKLIEAMKGKKLNP